ncbi:hypothetical protein [Pontibacter fetidus]|uniref:Uncharacterized protein n=1 Tax=Pontibacter fetidus TaxID=2700082 RepID=A0A6B2H0X1_9BACT|nr:hypothetical protein [Pontibacter fetidus]NDK56745.1 hypothetical protein [Pontibacter fetidus]
MKISKTIYLPLLVLLGAFTACSPDSEEVSPSASLSQGAKTKPAAAAKESLTLSLSFSDNPVKVGSEVTVTAVVMPNPNEGVIRIQRAVDALGNYTTVALATDWLTVDEETVTTTDAMASYTYTPDAVGMFGFRSHYIPKGGSGYGATMSTADLEVIAACTGKLTFTGEAKATQLSGNLYRIEATYTLAACEDFTNLKLQGGNTAHTTYVEAIPIATAARETGNGNVVTTWEGINMTGGTTRTYKVIFDKELKSAGTHTVTGDWSVKGTDASGAPIEMHVAELTVTI